MGIRLPDGDGWRELLARAGRWAGRFQAERLGTDHVWLAATQAGAGSPAAVLSARGLTTDRMFQTALSMLPGPRRKLVAASEDPLADIGIDVSSLRATAEQAFGSGALSDDRIWLLTPFCDRAITVAEAIAERLGDAAVRPAHLLLASLWLGADEAGQLLRGAGIEVPALRDDLLASLPGGRALKDLFAEQWDASEQVGAKELESARARNPVRWARGERLEETVRRLLDDGGTLAIEGAASLDPFWREASRRGFVVSDLAAKHHTTFWLAVDPARKQAVILSAVTDGSGAVAGVGATDPTAVPPWARDEPFWPRFPLSALRG